jgi:stage II sporulation protein M
MISPEDRLHYHRQLRPYVAISVGLFIGAALVGAIATFYIPRVSRYFNQDVAEFVKLFRALPKPQLAAAIFLNNAIKSLLVMAGGVVFGLFPVIFLLANGAALGIVLSASVRSRGLLPALLAILPHGIFELPAILLASSMGLLLGGFAIKRLFRRANISLRNELVLAMSFFTRIVLPLLVVAAVVEAFLTAILVS